MKNFLKNEKGAMTVYAITSIIVFTFVLGAIYYSAVSVRKMQLQTMPEIKEVYEKYLSSKYDIHEAEVEKRRDKVPPTISISFSAQTAKVGESVTATITINDNRDRLNTSNCSYTCSGSSGAFSGTLSAGENTVQINCTAVGTYSITVYASDLDKNSAQSTSSITVTE